MGNYGIDGLYASINAYINERKDTNHECIHVPQVIEAVKKDVNVYKVSIEWIVERYLVSAVENCLNKAGYRVNVKGTGLFVHPEMIKNPAIMARVYNNKSLSVQKAQQVLDALGRTFRRAEIEGQMCIDFDNPGTYLEDLTEEEMIQICMEEAYREG